MRAFYGIESGNDGNRLIQEMIDKNALGPGGFKVVARVWHVCAGGPRQQARQPVVFPAGLTMNAKFVQPSGSYGDDYSRPRATAAPMFRCYVSECANVGKLQQSGIRWRWKRGYGGLEEPMDAAAAQWLANPGDPELTSALLTVVSARTL
jgi:glycine betaine/proline transport system substrate-binding protein